MKTLLMGLLISTPSLAFEIASPAELCSRFVTTVEKDHCLKWIKEKKPDTYVGSLCRDLHDDQVFYQCLTMATQTQVDPKKLQTCQAENAPDEQTMACLKRVAKKESTKFQRIPASFSPQKNPKKTSP